MTVLTVKAGCCADGAGCDALPEATIALDADWDAAAQGADALLLQ